MTLLDRARELLSDVLLHRAMRDMPAMNAALDQLEELLLPEHARELRAAAPDLTDAERRILQHATAWPKRYRNHYTTGPDCDNWAQLRALVARGLMRVSRGPDDIFGGMSVFQVTEAGFAALSAVKDRRHTMGNRRLDVALAHVIGERLPAPLYSVDDGPGHIATIERHGPAPERIECGSLLFVSFHGKRYVLAIAEYSDALDECDACGDECPVAKRNERLIADAMRDGKP